MVEEIIVLVLKGLWRSKELLCLYIHWFPPADLFLDTILFE